LRGRRSVQGRTHDIGPPYLEPRPDAVADIAACEEETDK
jgi:hypothetical protein